MMQQPFDTRTGSPRELLQYSTVFVFDETKLGIVLYEIARALLEGPGPAGRLPPLSRHEVRCIVVTSLIFCNMRELNEYGYKACLRVGTNK